MNLTETVREKIVSDILNGVYLPGDQIPTERSMAVLTDTSRVTVRRAYAELEEMGIITRQPSIGTVVSKIFVGNRDKIRQIGVFTILSDPFAVKFLDALSKACEKDDILVTIANTEPTPEAQAHAALRFATLDVKNLIICGFDRRFDFGIFERMRILGANLVFFDRVIPGGYADFVGLDNAHAGMEAGLKAIREGYRKFVVVDFYDILLDSILERSNAMLKVCSQHHCPYVRFSIRYNNPDESDWVELPPIDDETAILTVNDVAAVSLVKARPELAKRIFSIDGSDVARKAGVYSYHQPISQMALATVEALKNQQRLGSRWKARQYRFRADES